MSLLSVTEARQRILARFTPVQPTEIPLAQANHRVLSRDIRAGAELPPFDNSSMDGFAVHAADTVDAPVTLPVVADIPAGSYPDFDLPRGQAARIMTGAMLPRLADAVIPVEDTDFTERAPGTPAPHQVTLHKPVRAGDSVRRRGADLKENEVVLAAGRRLRAQDLGLLSMLGVAQVPVYRLPRIGLLSSGDELLPPEMPLLPGKVRDANSYTLAALMDDLGCEVVPLGIASDNAADVRSRLEQAAAANVDLILSSAGVSVGAYDYVKDVIVSDGELSFWRVDMRPGKPLAFGQYKDIPFIGLPGNPVSAFVGFEVFVRPVVEKLSGMTPRPRPVTRVSLAEAVDSDGRESYLRAVVTFENGRPQARLAGHQGSGNLRSVVLANALLIIPSGVKSLPPAAEVDAWLYED
ncbi:MAG: gephyrin-like molybdotransferase Glp [Chloroflexota bacterium]